MSSEGIVEDAGAGGGAGVGRDNPSVAGVGDREGAEDREESDEGECGT